MQVVLIVFAVYAAAYLLYGKKLVEQRVVKADPSRPTPAVARFDGVDYVPANKFVLYGHHFSSIAGAGPIVGPAIAMVWGWQLPLLWILFGNVFIGAVHDYLALMASVRYGGASIATVSETVMGRKARYIFLLYVLFALILVLAAFLSVCATLYTINPKAATKAIVYMPLALLFGFLVYRVGLKLAPATLLAVVLIVLGIPYAYKVPLFIGPVKGPEFWDTYHKWVIILSVYCIIAASLPVWYLLQPRDYLNAYLLWFFVLSVGVGGIIVGAMALRAPGYTEFAPKAIAGQPSPFWPVIPLIIACGSLSGFHSLVSSGTSSKQLASELDALLVGYGGMLTEGAVSSLGVILPISLAWNAPELYEIGVLKEGQTILNLSPVARFTVGYGYVLGKAAEKFGAGFVATYEIMNLYAAIALATFILTTLDTATRIGRFAWQEVFEWLRPRSPSAYRAITNRWVASLLPVLFAAAMAYPTVTIDGKVQAAFRVIWPAFGGTNQLLAALALLTAAL
ncbi:MAG TPA: carbon starvation protein A, partial [Chromatiaceae bacterium]|nr:carbon starvation protein A [Chromatiaceae bacterium]